MASKSATSSPRNWQAALEEQTKLRARIENAATEWQRTFDAMEEAVVILDPEGRILRLNRTARDTAGASYATLLGRTLDQIGAGEPWRRAAAMLAEWRAAGSMTPSQVQDETDGRSWELTGTVMSDEEGRDRILLVARDITLLAGLQSSVRRSETLAAMGQLVAGVAHEVRNPLFGISVNVDALEAELRGHGELDDVLGALRREVRRLSSLMEDLLEYGKPMPATLAVGPLEDVLDLAVAHSAALATVAGVAIERAVERGAWELALNRGRLAQVFENLLANAIQHSPPGGVVELTTEGFRRRGAPWVRCRVADQGSGFRPEDLPRVFEPFFSRRRGGTGLGLAIASRIVDEHGGTIYAVDREPTGAVMTVELPCVEP